MTYFWVNPHVHEKQHDRVIILLSVRAGLRAKEISSIRWSMVTDAQGAVTDTIHLVNGASKGKRGGREILMAKDLRQALVELQAFKQAAPEDRIIFSERDIGISPKALAIWFLTLYRDLGFKGASSHSGRRTFITKAAKRCIEAGAYVTFSNWPGIQVWRRRSATSRAARMRSGASST